MKEFRSSYLHAHTYFTPETRAKAVAFRELLQKTFPTELKVYRLFDEPIGPHPMGMFEVDFDQVNYEKIVLFLDENRNGLDILVHQNTDDEVWNHSEGGVWLGNVQPIDFKSLQEFMDGKIPGITDRVKTN